MLGVNQSQVSRWVRGGGELRGVLREAAERYVTAHGIELDHDEAATGENPDAVAEKMTGATGQGTPVEEAGKELVRAATGRRPVKMLRARQRTTPMRPMLWTRTGRTEQRMTHNPGTRTRKQVQGVRPWWGLLPVPVPAEAKGHNSLLDRINGAEKSSELADTGVRACSIGRCLWRRRRAGAQALARGWCWMRDPPPDGLHGDALFYLHTERGSVVRGRESKADGIRA